jgi:uncharacterized protein
MKLFKFLMVALLLMFSINAYSTSFDCVKARSVVEKSICSNASLSALDDQLTTLYSKVFKSSSTQIELKKQELDWIKTKLNVCTTVDCISVAYISRIAELNLLDQSQIRAISSLNDAQQAQSPLIPSLVGNSATDSTGLKIQTVKAEGVGSTIELAAQNAAQNALMQVVGSFIDVQKQLDKKTEITNGIRNETKSISTNIKDYSQGTIKAFKILDSIQESSLIRVTAEVVVRIDDFHAYIKKLAEGEVAVEEGLFTKLKSENKQQTNQAGLLFDNVISPIVTGEVIEFKVGEPKSLSDIGYKGGNERIDKMSQQYGNTNIITFRVSLSFNNEFEQNMRKTIESIATKKTTFNNNLSSINWHYPLEGISPLENGYSYLNDTVLVLHDGKHVFTETQLGRSTRANTHVSGPLLMEAYLFSNSKQELLKKASWLPDALSNYQSKDIPTSNVEISLIGSQDVTLQKEMFGKVTTGKLVVINGDYGKNFTTPWSMIGLTGTGGGVADLIIWENRSFLAFIAVDKDAFDKTKKIIVKLVN